MEKLDVKKLLAVVLFLPLLVGGGSSLSIYERSQKAVVTLSSPTEMASQTFCTAFAVSPHHIATAEHCLDTLRTKSSIALDGELVEQDSVIPVAYDGNDHVILWTEKEWKHWVRFAKRPLKVGDEVYVWGHPAGLNPELLRKGSYAGEALDDARTLRRMYDLRVMGGDSGSAIFNSKGEVVDIVTSVFSVSFHSFNMANTPRMNFTKEDMKRIGQ